MSKELIDKLIEHEGMRKYAYKDSMGYITIGIGRCLDQGKGKGLSVDEMMLLLNNDINDCKKQLEQNYVYRTLGDVRQEVLIEMCFNLGYSGLMKFTKMLAALACKDFKAATKEAEDSAWAKQISIKRLQDILYRMETGKYR